jgi:hypothetical protein
MFTHRCLALCPDLWAALLLLADVVAKVLHYLL